MQLGLTAQLFLYIRAPSKDKEHDYANYRIGDGRRFRIVLL
jgi:hypothetical protein